MSCTGLHVKEYMKDSMPSGVSLNTNPPPDRWQLGRIAMPIEPDFDLELT